VLEARYKALPRRQRSYGSIIAVIATDAPLATHQLNRIAKRAALGIGRVGSTAMHGSGEIVLAFSTANQVPRETRKMVYRMKILLDQRLDPLYEAVIEATEEAILNALCMARDMDGVNGNVCRALPLEDVKELVTKWQEERARQQAEPLPASARLPSADAPGARARAAQPAARPTAARGAEGMARPARPPGVPGTTRVERPDARSDSQEAKAAAPEPPPPPGPPGGGEGGG
jgi:D-aminopeptidase